jgi:neutral ceramidase
MSAVGTVLGEEALATASRIKTSPDLPLSGSLQILTCPGKATTPLNNAVSCSDAPGSKLPKCVFTDKDTGPVDLRIGLIRLGDLSIVNTDSNIGWAVWQQVKSQSPSPANTLLTALTYGPTHYVIPDAEYATNSYQATASMVKRGCAEKGFVDDALKMLRSAPPGAN